MNPKQLELELNEFGLLLVAQALADYLQKGPLKPYTTHAARFLLTDSAILPWCQISPEWLLEQCGISLSCVRSRLDKRLVRRREVVKYLREAGITRDYQRQVLRRMIECVVP